MKHAVKKVLNEKAESPPVRGRGLKQRIDDGRAGGVASPPVRGRGLKRVRELDRVRRDGRPPCGGVD